VRTNYIMVAFVAVATSLSFHGQSGLAIHAGGLDRSFSVKVGQRDEGPALGGLAMLWQVLRLSEIWPRAYHCCAGSSFERVMERMRVVAAPV